MWLQVALLLFFMAGWYAVACMDHALYAVACMEHVCMPLPVWSTSVCRWCGGPRSPVCRCVFGAHLVCRCVYNRAPMLVEVWTHLYAVMCMDRVCMPLSVWTASVALLRMDRWACAQSCARALPMGIHVLPLSPAAVSGAAMNRRALLLD